VVLGVLVPIVSVGVAVDVVHAAVVPAFERMVAAEAQGQAVLQAEGPGDGVVLGKIPVQPSSIALWSLVSVVVIFQGIEHPRILEVDA
jgi:hypothetical protein